MSNLEFFKKEAKNLLKDWKTRTKTVESDGSVAYSYSPKFYDVKDLFLSYEFSDKYEQDIKLSRAQHLVAKIADFKKWNELIQASQERLELAELLVRQAKNDFNDDYNGRVPFDWDMDQGYVDEFE